MAAGKSTVSRLLALRFDRGVHLEGDVFRRSIVSGRVEMTPDPSPEAVEQLRLRYKLERLYAGFVSDTPHVGLWLDTSDQTAEETVEEILALTHSHG
ncbi:MAG: AAA family ATPase [Gaiellaceae bacterium]